MDQWIDTRGTRRGVKWRVDLSTVFFRYTCLAYNIVISLRKLTRLDAWCFACNFFADKITWNLNHLSLFRERLT